LATLADGDEEESERTEMSGGGGGRPCVARGERPWMIFLFKGLCVEILEVLRISKDNSFYRGGGLLGRVEYTLLPNLCYT
jgi:hypothetical protein